MRPRTFAAACLAAFALTCAAYSRANAATPETSSTDTSSAPAQTATSIAPEVRKAISDSWDFASCDEYTSALEILVKAYDEGARDADLLEDLAVVELRLAKTSDAEKHLGEARTLFPADARFVLWSAVGASVSQNDRNAAALLAEGLRLAGDSEIALYDLAERFLRRGALSVSSEIYRKVNAVYPTDSMFDLMSVLHLAAYYGLTDRPADAAGILAKNRTAVEYSDVTLITTQECDYLAEYFKGLAAVRAGDLSGGLDLLRDAAAKYSRGLVADGAVVRVLDASGRKDEADGVYSIVSRELNDAIAAKPEKAEAWHDLAFFVAATRRNTREGLEAVDWSLRLAPLRPDYLATKADLLSLAGKNEEALIVVQRAMVLVSQPRWTEAGEFDQLMWTRSEILAKLGKPVPAAFLRLPAPSSPAAAE